MAPLVAPPSGGKCGAAVRRQMCYRTPCGLVSLDRQSPAAGDLDVLLRHRQAQYAVVVAGLDALGLDAGDIEAPRVAAVAALAADVIALLVLILVLAVALGANGHRVAVHIDVDVLFLKARQISFQQVKIALVLNIGLIYRRGAMGTATTPATTGATIPAQKIRIIRI